MKKGMCYFIYKMKALTSEDLYGSFCVNLNISILGLLLISRQNLNDY